ncbi:MAG: hypothetical protein NZ954_03710 [Thermofilaceae archaeon]|nr:hypothetical protein [Thermofilaceae archaeon]
MKGASYKGRKVLALALGAALVVALLATLPTVSAAPIIKRWTMRLVDQTGRRLANEEVLVAVWNETGKCAIAYFKGTTDKDGNLTLSIIAGTPLDFAGPYAGQTFNVTVAINKYGRWMLLNQSIGLTWSALMTRYLNKTIVAGHWWSLNFNAVTDVDGDGFDDPLYFSTGLGEDLASFVVFWNDTRVLITEIFAKTGTNTAKDLLNISDTLLDVSEVGTGCFLFRRRPLALYKEVVWNLFENVGEFKRVKVGAEILRFHPANKTVDIINATPLGRVGPKIRNVPLTPVTTIDDFAYTTLFRVNIRDPCGTLIDTGALETWKVFFQAEVEGRNMILRSGTPAAGVAPAFGAEAPGGFAFWLPDITKVYGKRFNITLNVNYYNVQVFTASIPTNRTSLSLGTYMTMVTTNNVRIVDAYTSVVKTRIIVKDSQPTPQPLTGARLLIAAQVGDPIYSATTTGGAAFLPPFTTTAVAETSGDFGRVYSSVYSDGGMPYGYLPVPFTYRARKDLVATYTVRIFWAIPGGERWIDVTPERNTFSLNITDSITKGCPITTFTFFAKVFEVKVRVLDLCNRPITPAAFPWSLLSGIPRRYEDWCSRLRR